VAADEWLHSAAQRAWVKSNAHAASWHKEPAGLASLDAACEACHMASFTCMATNAQSTYEEAFQHAAQ